MVDDLKGFAVFGARGFFTTFERLLEERSGRGEAAFLHVGDCEAILCAQRGHEPGVEGAEVASMDAFELCARGVEFVVLGPVEDAEAGAVEVFIGVFGWGCLFQVDENLHVEVFGFEEIASVAVHVC